MPLFRKSTERSPSDVSATDVHHGTVAQRNAFIDARRERASDRDAPRRAYAGGGAVDIPRERGYAVAPPGTLDGVDAVVAAANGAIDAIGHDAIVSGRMKGGFMATKLLPDSALSLDSPYFRLALDEGIVRAIAEYLGVVPILSAIDIWYSVAGPEATPRSSQMWHLDHADIAQVKIFVNLNDVTPEMGPLTIVDAAASERLASRPGYDFGKGNRVPDADVEREVGSDKLVSFDGPAGSAGFVDTSRCFHFGSRVQPGAPPRRVAMFQYLTPYAFDFPEDPAGHAPFSALATPAQTELERLVLGA